MGEKTRSGKLLDSGLSRVFRACFSPVRRGGVRVIDAAEFSGVVVDVDCVGAARPFPEREPAGRRVRVVWTLAIGVRLVREPAPCAIDASRPTLAFKAPLYRLRFCFMDLLFLTLSNPRCLSLISGLNFGVHLSRILTERLMFTLQACTPIQPHVIECIQPMTAGTVATQSPFRA